MRRNRRSVARLSFPNESQQYASDQTRQDPTIQGVSEFMLISRGENTHEIVYVIPTVLEKFKMTELISVAVTYLAGSTLCHWRKPDVSHPEILETRNFLLEVFPPTNPLISVTFPSVVLNLICWPCRSRAGGQERGKADHQRTLLLVFGVQRHSLQ